VEGVAQFPKTGLWDVHGDFMVKAEYENGISMYVNSGFPAGIKYEGDEGWIFVSHVGKNTFDASDPRMLGSEIKENEIHLYHSDEHHGNWLECIKSRKQPISPIEIGHRACTMCLISHIAMKVPGVLQWDPKGERFRKNDRANSLLKRKQRFPYGTDYLKLI
jgi:hypothetical protein